MRVISNCLLFLMISSTFNQSHADPYRWCAVYGGNDDGATNCYFVTLEQCKWAIPGNGGFCRPNLFYDGRPMVTPEHSTPRRGKLPQKHVDLTAA